MKNLSSAALENYIIYLRKSRADNPDESIEEVLSRHEAELQEYAEKMLGGKIPEECIYREVVSGETIAERPAMQNVLAEIENPEIKAVLVVEPQRLSRGDLEDCGKIVNAFRYTATKVMTLNMTYDLSNKMERKFFEQELMRGNDYLEYTKEILLRGRVRSVKKGAYIGSTAPFGYDKTVIGGIHTLAPNENAEAVKLAFNMFVNQGKSFLEIARYFNSIGIKPMHNEKWSKSSIRWILKNDHYAGYVRFGGYKTQKVVENGQIVKRREKTTDAEYIVVNKGIHEALISQELYDAAQDKINSHPRVNIDKTLKNPLASILKCADCGKTMSHHPYKNAKSRVECRNPNCKGKKSVTADEMLDAVIFALEQEKLPELEVRLKNNDGQSLKIQQAQIKKMNDELAELKEQEERQYVFLEKGIYSEDVFIKRNTDLHAEMDALKTRIFEAKKVLPKEVDYGERIVKLKEAIAGLRNEDISPTEKNKLLKAIVERIDYKYLGYESRGKVIYQIDIKLLI